MRTIAPLALLFLAGAFAMRSNDNYWGNVFSPWPTAVLAFACAALGVALALGWI